jgi:hypothetical protein
MKSQIETWKWIDGYEDLYKVSDCGTVKRMNYHRIGKERVLKGMKDKKGYLQVGLWKNGVQKRFTIHRLVAQAFLPNPNNLPQVNHKDEVKTNNHLENLEWCTPKYNSNYGTRNEKIRKKQLNDLSKSKPVKQYTLDGKILKEWSSASEVQRQTGFNNTHISACCNGKRKSAYHFKWSF